MTNVTFQPRRMSPWRLQECFFDACDTFYDLPSAFRIWRLFGAEYGLRRIYLAAGTSLGVPLARFVADHFPDTPYYKLKRVLWKYADQQADVDERRATDKGARRRPDDARHARAAIAALVGIGAIAAACLGGSLNEKGIEDLLTT